ncbi:DUF1307 domain-containing protein [Streptococcus rifensis]
MTFYKKIVLPILTILALIFLSACGFNKEPQSANLQLFDASGFDSRISIDYQGDRITHQSTDNTIYYSYLGLENKEEVENFFQEDMKNYQNIVGVTHSAEFLDDRMVEHVSIDYSKANLTEIASILNMTEDEAEKVDYISYQKTAELLKTEGYTEINDAQFQELK